MSRDRHWSPAARTTVIDRVRAQVLAEGPDSYDGMDMCHEPTRERYIDDIINAMPNTEMLERISNAIGDLR